MSNISKEKAIAEYKRVKSKLGHKPGLREFFGNVSISKRQIEFLFGAESYSKLVKAAGDEPTLPFHLRPNKITKELSLEAWGNVIKKLGHLPKQAEWTHQKFSPSVGWYEKKFGSWKVDLPNAFLEFAQGKPQWNAVVRLLSPEKSIMRDTIHLVRSRTNDFGLFIPPIYQNLEELSAKDYGHLDFEEKVNKAFESLGLQVERLGQGTGRNPDGIAIDRQNHYAIFLDAKTRRNGYSAGTDDRTFIEYVRSWEPHLRESGITHFYFAVVSSRFRGDFSRQIKNLKRETGISALVMIPVKSLLRLIAAKVQSPAKFNMKKFQELFVQDGELNVKKTEKWISNLRGNLV